MHLYLDIETVPSQRPGAREEIAAKLTPPANYKKAETIEAWERDEKSALAEEAYRKTSFDGALGHVISIAFAVNGDLAYTASGVLRAQPGIDTPLGYEDFIVLERKHLAEAFQTIEAALQEAANAEVKHHLGPGRGYVRRDLAGNMVDCEAHVGFPTVVAHHADFDIRFLYHRAVILGVPVPAWWPVNQRPNGPSDIFAGGPRVFDTMTYWAGYGGRIGQDRLCAALGIERGDDITGDQVYDQWLAGGGDAILDHNIRDVERLRKIHRRLTFWTPPPGLIKAPPGAKPAKRKGYGFPASWGNELGD